MDSWNSKWDVKFLIRIAGVDPFEIVQGVCAKTERGAREWGMTFAIGDFPGCGVEFVSLEEVG